MGARGALSMAIRGGKFLVRNSWSSATASATSDMHLLLRAEPTGAH